ncbi:MAG TPA: hypothetical protein VIJ82_08635 [Streptosporangiaceae bacterium]|jgi:hypothetical protein
MRPTVAEQIAGLGRILAAEVRPEVSSEYAQDVLAGVLQSLEVLASGLAAIGPFLAWDNAAMTAILREAGAGAQPGAGPPGAGRAGSELEQLNQANEQLRAQLDGLLAQLGDRPGQDQARRAIVAHLDERASRFPLRLVPRMPRRPDL